jgi:hypothetical protein
MLRNYDGPTGRPLAGGRDLITELTDDELEIELTIAVAEPTRRAHRLDQLLLERAKRKSLDTGELAWR